MTLFSIRSATLPLLASSSLYLQGCTGSATEVISLDASRPVMVGSGCNTNAFVMPAGDEEDNALVLAAPDRHADFSDWVGRGYVVSICEETRDGLWKGIVYLSPQFFGPDQSEPIDPGCGLDRDQTAMRAYDGPCKSGWVEARELWWPAD